MSGNSLLLDTNVILYLLAGDSTLAALINGKDVHISFISEIELLSFKKLSVHEEQSIKYFLNDVTITDLNPSIKKKTISIRKEFGLKIPDSIIAATAGYLNMPVLTADEDFKKINTITHLHYQR
ncbi:MAG: type II toxin-antitoxin system VapC family toxin [Chitinophagaceae bacterium]|jgi:predicted nucleic acid-binding protein|nr:type II toxin-antitoxin system VapC family toxin [Chitinophagaceae bacterium]